MMTDSTAPRPQPVSFDTLWRYGIGQVGGQVFRDAPATLLPIFMSTMLGVPPWMAGLAVIVPKLWLILCDPFVGALSDRFNARWGRTPFLLVGAAITSVGFASMFFVPVSRDPAVSACIVSFLFFLASTGFSAFSVPYLALSSEVSDDGHQRSRMIAARIVGAIAGVIAGIGLAQPLIGYFGGGMHAWRVTTLTLAGLCLVTMLTTAATMHGRADRPAATTPAEGMFRNILHALKERDFRWLTLTYFLQCVSQGCSFTVVSFIFILCVGNVNLILPFVLIMSVGSMVSQPLWLALAKRWGNQACFLISNIGYIVLSITAFWIEPGTDVLLRLPFGEAVSTQQAIVLLRGFPLAVFNSGFLLFTLSMFTDTVNRAKKRSHSQLNEGVFSGIFTATEKLSFAVAPLLAGVVMSASGFSASTGGIHSQSRQALAGILATYSIIPAAIMALSLLSFHQYRTATRQRV
jgi:GPH family glycoside/pentoside/hexuronide:cation symporter